MNSKSIGVSLELLDEKLELRDTLTELELLNDVELLDSEVLDELVDEDELLDTDVELDEELLTSSTVHGHKNGMSSINGGNTTGAVGTQASHPAGSVRQFILMVSQNL